MLEQSLAIVDIETTGAAPPYDRITEVAVIQVKNRQLVEEWSTLVNPGMRIPPAISALTGISNEMVANAPSFAQIARELRARLDRRLFVAHNARFDYGFIRNEFERLGARFSAKVLCTVKLSRKLYPKERHHNLNAIIGRLSLFGEDRHRALGDARVLLAFVQDACKRFGPQAVADAADAVIGRPALPARIEPVALDAIPDAAGVYVFYGDNDVPLYVGKSTRLRARVLSHFSGDRKVTKDMHMARQIARIEHIETAGELGALLLEARLVKALAPAYNRRLRGQKEMLSFHFDFKNKAQALKLINVNEFGVNKMESLYGLFKSRQKALQWLRQIADERRLCHKLLGLDKRVGACFGHQLEKCAGACVGKETRAQHDARLLVALSMLRVKPWPFRGKIGIREADEFRERAEVHVFDRWCHLGSFRTQEELGEADAHESSPLFDPDVYKILTKFFASNRKGADIVDLGPR